MRHDDSQGYLTVRSAYDESASQAYDDARFTTPSGKLFHSLEVNQLQGSSELVPRQSTVLEVGCGTGRFVNTVLHSQRNLICVDPSEYMLRVAQAKHADKGLLCFVRAEAAALPFPDDSFDFAYSIRVLSQVGTAGYAMSAITEMVRVVKSGGLALVEFCNARRPVLGSGLRLNPDDVRELIARQYPGSSCVASNGILILSQTLLDRVPTGLLGWFAALDGALSRRFPEHSARCYLTFRKGLA